LTWETLFTKAKSDSRNCAKSEQPDIHKIIEKPPFFPFAFFQASTLQQSYGMFQNVYFLMD